MTESSRTSQISSGVGTPPSFLPTRPPLVSSRMISLHNSTHSSQMKTVGPAISLRTSCCDFPQKLQYRVLFESEPVTFVIRSEEHTSELQSLMRISYAVFCLK